MLGLRGVRLGIPICEDIWTEESATYENVVECLAETGAELLIVPNGSPYWRSKSDVRLNIAVARVTEQYLAVEIADGVEVKVQKSAVGQLLPKGTLKSI